NAALFDTNAQKTAAVSLRARTEVPCSVQWAALANEFKKIERRLAEGCSMHGSVGRLAQTWPRLLAQPHVDVCVAQPLLGSRWPSALGRGRCRPTTRPGNTR